MGMSSLKKLSLFIIISNVLSNDQATHTFNPVDLAVITAPLSNGDSGHLFFANPTSRSIAGFGFVTGFNWALRQGHAEKAVARIHELRLKVTGPVRDRLDRLTTYLEQFMATTSLTAEYQEGKISHREILDSIGAYD